MRIHPSQISRSSITWGKFGNLKTSSQWGASMFTIFWILLLESDLMNFKDHGNSVQNASQNILVFEILLFYGVNVYSKHISIVIQMEKLRRSWLALSTRCRWTCNTNALKKMHPYFCRCCLINICLEERSYRLCVFLLLKKTISLGPLKWQLGKSDSIVDASVLCADMGATWKYLGFRRCVRTLCTPQVQ